MKIKTCLRKSFERWIIKFVSKNFNFFRDTEFLPSIPSRSTHLCTSLKVIKTSSSKMKWHKTNQGITPCHLSESFSAFMLSNSDDPSFPYLFWIKTTHRWHQLLDFVGIILWSVEISMFCSILFLLHRYSNV